MGGDSAAKPLTRRAISDAVAEGGWRFALGALRTVVSVSSTAQTTDLVSRALTVSDACDAGLLVDVRPGRVALTLQSQTVGWVTRHEIAAAGSISGAVAEVGLATVPALADDSGRSVQAIEIAIDAVDIASVRPFWKAVMGYVGGPEGDDEADALVDPWGQSPAIWFQQMEEPRRQRNRIHLDVSVPHDEASRRIAATLAAGGVLVSDGSAPAFWVLADQEGNEACVTTWQGRDD